MITIKIIHVIYTLCVGFFAGLLWTFELAVIPMLNTLSASDYARIEQLLIKYIDTNFMNAITLASIAMLLPLYPLIRHWKQRQTKYWLFTFLGWLLFFFGVGLFTILLNVPINEYVKTWSIENPPSDWMQARDRWNFLNHIRTPINYVSFILLLISGFYIQDVAKSQGNSKN
jgi:uncharacterized membrane protein